MEAPGWSPAPILQFPCQGLLIDTGTVSSSAHCGQTLQDSTHQWGSTSVPSSPAFRSTRRSLCPDKESGGWQEGEETAAVFTQSPRQKLLLQSVKGGPVLPSSWATPMGQRLLGPDPQSAGWTLAPLPSPPLLPQDILVFRRQHGPHKGWSKFRIKQGCLWCFGHLWFVKWTRYLLVSRIWKEVLLNRYLLTAQFHTLQEVICKTGAGVKRRDSFDATTSFANGIHIDNPGETLDNEINWNYSLQPMPKRGFPISRLSQLDHKCFLNNGCSCQKKGRRKEKNN